MKTLLVGGALLLIVLGSLIYFGLPDYSWHQKMTITVEADGKTYSGSSVVRVRFRKNDPLSAVNGPEWISSYGGEGSFLDIPGRGILFVTVNPPDQSSFTSDLALEVFSDDLPQTQFVEQLKALENGVGLSTVLSLADYPFFVFFRDIANPESVVEVDPENLSATFGRGVRLKSIELEITDEPVTFGRMETVLPWLKSVWPNTLDGRSIRTIKASNQLANSLTATSFSTGINR